MHLPINVKSPNNISKWQMGFNSTFKGLIASFYLRMNILQRTDFHRYNTSMWRLRLSNCNINLRLNTNHSQYNRHNLVWLHSCKDIDSYKNTLSCAAHVNVYMYQLTRHDIGEASDIRVEFLIDCHSHCIQSVVCMSSNWRLLGSHYKVSKLR
jgi:hypothetical protein